MFAVCFVFVAVQKHHVGAVWLRKIYDRMRSKITTTAAYVNAKQDLEQKQQAETKATNESILKGEKIGAKLPKKSAAAVIAGGGGGNDGE